MRTTTRGAAVVALGTLLTGALATAPASAAPAGSWLTARGNDARLGQAMNETVVTKGSIAHLAPIWSAPGQSVDRTEAIVQGNAVYSVTTDARLRRLNGASGGTSWTSVLPAVGTTPSIDGGTVFVYAGSTVRALTAASGATRYTKHVPGFCGDGTAGCFGGIGTANGKIVVGAGGLLHVLDEGTGAVLATTDVSEGDFDSGGGGTPAIDGNDAAWASYKFTGTLAVPPSTASPVPSPKISGNGYATPLIVGGRAYVTAINNGIVSFSVSTGAKTTVVAGAVGQHRDLATDGTRLFDVVNDGGVKTLTAYSLATGAALWSRSGAVTSPLSVNGMVIVGEANAGLAVYDAASGALLKRLPGTARGANPIVVGGRVYAGYTAANLPAGTNPPLTALGVGG